MRYINHWYGKARSNKNVSGQHDPFSNYDFGHGWLYYLHLRLSAIGDTDLMNALYAQLGEDVFSLSETSTKYPDIDLDIPLATTTPTPTKVDVQKEQVATALVTKNNAASSLIELQKQHVVLELSQMLDKQLEELEDKLFKMEEELHQLTVQLLSTNGEAQKQSLQRRQSYLKKKLARGNKKLNELEIKINNGPTENKK